MAKIEPSKKKPRVNPPEADELEYNEDEEEYDEDEEEEEEIIPKLSRRKKKTSKKVAKKAFSRSRVLEDEEEDEEEEEEATPRISRRKKKVSKKVARKSLDSISGTVVGISMASDGSFIISLTCESFDSALLGQTLTLVEG